MDSSESEYMRMAVALARKCSPRSGLRPRAGAVVVARGKPVGYGYSMDAGKPSVLTALEMAGGLASGAEVYTNTEPCSDCPDSEAYVGSLLEYRPRRIVIGGARPNPGAAAGRVLATLESAGIAIESGFCEDDCRRVNEVFHKYQSTGLPFVTVKYAASLDGRIATRTGDSQWISSQASLRLAHKLRREHEAILVGIGTVIADDPQLTVRLVKGPNPIRIVVDTSLRIPETARLLSDADSHRTIIATTDRADLSRAPTLERLGAEILVLPSAPRAAGGVSGGAASCSGDTGTRYGVNLKSLLAALGQREMGSVLVEGGSAIITSLLAERSIDRLVVAIANKIIGKGVEAIGDLGIDRLSDAIVFSSTSVRRLGGDVIFDGRIDRR